MNNDIFLNCPKCNAETLHQWYEAEPENQLPEVWICINCLRHVYKEDID